VEMGGSDQLFNNLVGRDLMEQAGKEGQCVIVTPLLVGTDGVNKMSKSKKNYIAVTDAPSGQEGMFGKIMSLPDALMESYYTLLTDIPEAEFKARIVTSPRDAKITLAKHVIAWLHTPAEAEGAAEEFMRVFSRKEVPDDMPEVKIDGLGPHKLAPLIVKAGLASSNGEAIRKIKENAVSLDGVKVSPGDFNKEQVFTGPVVLKLGRKFARLVV